MPPDCSVVVPTLANHAALRRVLDGFGCQTVAADAFEVLVVADANEPRPEAVDAAIGDRPYRVRRLDGSPPGASANRNSGWRAATAPIVLFVDDDTVPAADLVARHLAIHAREPDRRVAVAGHVRWAPGLTVTPFMRWLDRGVQFDYAAAGEGHWGMLYTANASIKRGFLQEVGPFDEERLPYGYEDTDWGYRAHTQGLRVIYDPKAIVDHWRTMTPETWQERAPRLAVSEWAFSQKHPEIPPWFHGMFSAVDGSARGASLANVVAPWVPWLGPRVWARAGRRWRREIAPAFMDAWNRAAAGELTTQPALDAVLAERGSPPSGPK